MQRLISESSADEIADAGLIPPSAERIAINSSVLIDPSASASIGGGQTEFEIPPGLSGEINIAGTANVYQLIKRTSDSLTRDHTQLTVRLQASDSETAVSQLCNGEVQIAMVDLQVEDASTVACEDGQVRIISLPIGTQAAVLLGNSADDIRSV